MINTSDSSLENMRNLRISTRLIGSFALLLGMLLTLATTSLLQLGDIHNESDNLAKNWLPSVQVINAIDAEVSELRLTILAHVMSTDDASMVSLDKQIKEQRTQLAEIRKQYEELISSPEERKIYEEFVTGWTKYVEVNNKALQLSRKNENAAAAAIISQESRPLYLALKSLTEKLVQLNAQGAAAAAKSATETYASAKNIVIAVSVAAVIVVFLAAAWLIRSITAPLAQAVQAADRIAAGDLSGQIVVQSKDETGLLLQALQHMQQSLVNIVSSVRQNAEGVASASSQIASGNNDLSARTEQQASALEETAASMEELSSTVRQNADNARTANELAVTASTIAVQGGDVVAEVVETMKGINSSSNKIADIISVIDGIAFQTNILALNAAVEAARAGEQGRGFAVVAAEVRSLAGRSAEAAKEIKSLIAASVESVGQGSALVDKAGATMTEVVASIRRVTDIMGEISAASNEQSAGVSQVGEAVTQMDQATQQNAALVEEMAAAASALNSQAGELVTAVAVFKLNATTPKVEGPAPISPPAYTMHSNHAIKHAGMASKAPIKPSKSKGKLTATTVVSKSTNSTSTAQEASLNKGSSDDWESF
ncbi:UNVERIFIED_ORG: methyl-accepting chemotaxis protein-1 (serine sensor receptor) [Comamonas terrigena]